MPQTVIDKGKIIWTLDDLPPLMVGDNLAFKAEGYQIPLVGLISAESFHWAMVGARQIDDEISIGDYGVHDSTNKGITAHLLSEYQTRHMRVYRPVLPQGRQEALKDEILKRYLYWGDQHYDYFGVAMVGVWWLIHEVKPDFEWFVHNSHKFWCLEFNFVVWRDFGLLLVPESEPPHPGNMERSSNQKLIWGTY
ncbi:MAG: hypothetical protein PHI12_06525 [Dehalococcoidales bacterium]|nr:hypothetical protein [Dehalococcoidales bacterium]